MKKSTLLLAILSMSSTLYAQPAPSALTREQVLDVFSRFNPVVLEKARQDATYQTVLEQLLVSCDSGGSCPSRWEMIALARNFENSLYLDQLTKVYQELWLSSQMMGLDIRPQRELFTLDVRDIFTRFWAVTVQLKEYQLDTTQQALRQVLRDKTLSPQARTEQQTRLKTEIKALKEEIKAFKKNPGEQICFLTQNHVEQAEQQAREQAFEVNRRAAEQEGTRAAQSENLQIKSKHKKPVAQ